MVSVSVVKSVANFVAGLGAGMCVTNAIKATTPSNLSSAQKLVTAIGGMVLSGIVAGAASDYAEKKIDDITTCLKEISEAVEEANSEKKEEKNDDTDNN